MRFEVSDTDGLVYDDLLESDTRRAVEVLNDGRVDVDYNREEIRIPQEYFEKSNLAFVNDFSNTANESVTRCVEHAFESLRDRESLPENPAYRFGRKSADEEQHESISDLGFRVWSDNDNQRKTAWGIGACSVGSTASYLGEKEESAVGFALGAGVFMGLNSYFRGRRDRTVDQAIEGEEGLRSAYGDYNIEVKNQKRRKDKIENAMEWTRDVIENL